MKVKNIKSFIDFYKSIGVTIEMGKNQRKLKEGHFQLTTSPKKINIENHKKLESNIDLNTLKKSYEIRLQSKRHCFKFCF